MNGEGFFITAYHCVDEMIPPDRGAGKVRLLLYGPSRKMVLPGRILSYIPEYDLALGQVRLPDHASVQPVKIAGGPLKPRQILYNKRYANLAYITSKLIKSIISLFNDPFGDQAIGRKELKNRQMAEPLKPEVCVGRTIQVNTPHNGQILGPRPGWYFLMTGPQNTRQGHSGSPVFDLNSRLVGIVVEIPEKPGIFKTNQGKSINLAYFSGPENIRYLIENYIH